MRVSVEKQNLFGVIGMFIASFLFGVMAFFVRVVSFDSNPYFIVFFRSLFGAVMILFFMFLRREKIKIVNKKVVMLRGIFGALAILFWFHNISSMGIPKAVFYFYAFPLYTAFFAKLFFNEKIYIWHYLGIAFVIAGLFFLSELWKFSFSFSDFKGVLSGVFAALAMIYVHEARKTDSTNVIVLSFLVFAVLGSFFPALSNIPEMAFSKWMYLILIPVLSTIAQIIMTFSYKYCKHTQGSIVSSSSVVVPVVLGVIFLNEKPSLTTLIGGVFILLGGITVSIFRERAQSVKGY